MSVTPALPARGSYPDLARRAAVTLAGVLLVVLALVPRNGALVLALVAAFASGWEYRALTAPERPRMERALSGLLGLACAAGCVLAVGTWPGAAWLVLAGSLALLGPQLVLRAPPARFLAGPLYFGALPAFMVLSRYGPQGHAWVAVLLAASWGGSIASYLVGRAVGRRRLAPRISPAKTVEGAIGGLLCGSVLAVVAASFSRDTIPPATIAWIAPLAQALAQAGDLVESRLKRRCGVKDSGTLLAAQGGMLDCVDGLCLAAPFVYLASGLARG